MENLFGADIFATLGLSWQKILLYLANFVILFVGLTFLLYKPVKKFMDKRKQEIADEVGKADKVKEEALLAVKESEERAKNAEEEAKKRVLEMDEEKKAAVIEREEILAEARKEAENIRTQAEQDANDERQKAVLGAKTDVASLAVGIAKEILGRELSEKDNDKLIDECIKEWKGDD